MVRPHKVEEVELLTDKLSRASSVVLVDFRGLDVARDEQLRNRCREAAVEYRVVKNTLMERAVNNVEIEGLKPLLVGPTALAISYDDPVVAAHVIRKFADDFGILEIKGGVLDGITVGVGEVKRLADLPSREELLAQVARCFQGPMTRLASVMQAPLRQVLQVVSELEKKAG